MKHGFSPKRQPPEFICVHAAVGGRRFDLALPSLLKVESLIRATFAYVFNISYTDPLVEGLRRAPSDSSLCVAGDLGGSDSSRLIFTGIQRDFRAGSD